MRGFWWLLGGVALWESFWWIRRRSLRTSQYLRALKRAQELNKPLVVVGAPDGGITSGYGCGDITIDIQGSAACPVVYKRDIAQRIPLEDNSAVVFVSCVLEYVENFPAALAELKRVAGKELYVVRVEPWTLTAYLYPGTRRRIPVLGR